VQVENPGSTSLTFADRRKYGGGIRLRNRRRSPSTPLLSFIRGARISTVPLTSVSFSRRHQQEQRR
jgi:hypothetical protein